FTGFVGILPNAESGDSLRALWIARYLPSGTERKRVLGVPSYFPAQNWNDSRADPPSAPEAGRQIADHGRVAARLAAGTHHPPHQTMPETRGLRTALLG